MEKIAVIGIGRLGLCLALNLEKVGYEVLGVDKDEALVKALNAGTFQSVEPLVNTYLGEAKFFRASTAYTEIFESDIRLLFFVLPTPSLPDGSFDHSVIDAAVTELLNHNRSEQQRHIVINSTTMPGYCDALQKRLAEHNWLVSYNPEFIAQGTIIRNQQYPDQVLIGEANEEAGLQIEQVYRKMCRNNPVFCRMQRLSAEITKLATNCFLTTKIAFANAIGDLSLRAGAEPEKILQAIGADSRIGKNYLGYGFGYGGPCFPRDNKAFGRFANAIGLEPTLQQATDKANHQHAVFLKEKWMLTYKPDEEIHFNSVTYKPGTDILEESQQLRLAVDLAKEGYRVVIHEQAAVIEYLQETYGELFVYVTNGQ